MTKTIDRHTTDDDILTVLRNHIPVDSLVYGYALDEHVFTTDRGY